MMRFSLWAGSLLLVGLGASAVQAQQPAPPPRPSPPPQHRVAPDACGPGFYVSNPCGMVYGPNYWLYPPFPPFSGGAGMGQQPLGFPYHPFARSPRDYFMLD